jgi:hypothetical protein
MPTVVPYSFECVEGEFAELRYSINHANSALRMHWGVRSTKLYLSEGACDRSLGYQAVTPAGSEGNAIGLSPSAARGTLGEDHTQGNSRRKINSGRKNQFI